MRLKVGWGQKWVIRLEVELVLNNQPRGWQITPPLWISLPAQVSNTPGVFSLCFPVLEVLQPPRDLVDSREVLFNALLFNRTSCYDGNVLHPRCPGGSHLSQVTIGC